MSKSSSQDVVSFEDKSVGEVQSSKPVEDIEVKDAQLIFHSVWHELEKEVGAENLKFPAEIFWLNGAPEQVKALKLLLLWSFATSQKNPSWLVSC